MLDILFLNLPSSRDDIMTIYPPIGILSMSSILKENNYSVEFIDADVHRLTPKEVVEQIEYFNPKVIGISVNISHLYLFDEYIDLIQNSLKNITIIIGGPYITSNSNEIFKDFPNIKYAVFGEGEYAILDFMEFINSKREIKDVRNLIINNNGKSELNRYERVKDLDTLALPDYSIVKDFIHLYRSNRLTPTIKSPSMAILCARGCPFNCKFCSSTTPNKYKIIMN